MNWSLHYGMKTWNGARGLVSLSMWNSCLAFSSRVIRSGCHFLLFPFSDPIYSSPVIWVFSLTVAFIANESPSKLDRVFIRFSTPFSPTPKVSSSHEVFKYADPCHSPLQTILEWEEFIQFDYPFNSSRFLPTRETPSRFMNLKNLKDF